MTTDPPVQDPFGYNGTALPDAFIQWKGTEACLDFHCDCGLHSHFDGFFAHFIKCPGCDQIWEMPFKVYPRKATDTRGHKPLEAEQHDIL